MPNENQEDDFGAAFNAAITAMGTPAAAPTAATPPVEPVAPTAATPPVEPVAPTAATPPVEPVAPTAATPPVEPVAPTAATPPVEPVAPTAATPPVEPAAVIPTPPEPVAVPVTPTPPAPAAPAAAPAPQTQAEIEAAILKEIPDPVLSAEDDAKIKAFEKDWPDLVAPMQLQVAHATKQIEARFARLISSVVQSIYADIAPIAQSYVKVESNSFRSAVLQAHPDYDQVFPKLESWIDNGQNPPYLRDAMKHAYTAGSAEDVIDLVSRYKASAGLQPQMPQPAAGVIPAAPDPKAAARIAELAPVRASRTAPAPSGSDPNDYQGAFEEAAAALTRK